MILILDYGAQYTQLIARRVREKNVYSEIAPFNASLEKYRGRVEGIVLSGGPASVYEREAPWLPKEVVEWSVPVLGICYGAQLMVHSEGGKVTSGAAREYGRADIEIKNNDDLFHGLEKGKKTYSV